MITSNAKRTWEEYLSTGPTTREIARIFFCNSNEGLNKLAWEELKSRNDIENKDILDVVLFCSKPRCIRDDAWEMLSNRNPSQDEINRILSTLKTSDQIVKDIIETFGPSKEYLLQKVKEEVE